MKVKSIGEAKLFYRDGDWCRLSFSSQITALPMTGDLQLWQPSFQDCTESGSVMPVLTLTERLLKELKAAFCLGTGDVKVTVQQNNLFIQVRNKTWHVDILRAIEKAFMAQPVVQFEIAPWRPIKRSA